MCQAQDTLQAPESIASVGQMRSRLLPISLAGNQECSPSPPPHPLPLPPLCLLLPFLIAHTKLTRRSVTTPSRDHEKTATNFPRGAGLWAQMLCICALSVCACRNGICAICNDRQSHVPVRWKCHSTSTDIFGLANKKQSLYYFLFYSWACKEALVQFK